MPHGSELEACKSSPIVFGQIGARKTTVSRNKQEEMDGKQRERFIITQHSREFHRSTQCERRSLSLSHETTYERWCSIISQLLI